MYGTASREQITVGIGECRIGRAPASLSTVALGSCVAVMAWDWKLKLGGLLHIMLPDSSIDPRRAARDPHVFADTGVAELLRALLARGAARRRLSWCLTGGASMMAGTPHFETGKRNELAVKKTFRSLGLFAEEEDLGGTESRSVRFDLSSGRIVVRTGRGQETVLRSAATVSLD